MDELTLDRQLIIEAIHGNIDKIEDLLRRGADVNYKDTESFTGLMYSAYFGFDDCLQLFLERGVTVDDKNKFGSTALMLTTSLSCAEKLLMFGADINSCDFNGDSALLAACKKRYSDSMKYTASMKYVDFLLQRGANNNSQDSEGKTPLMIVLSRSNFTGDNVFEGVKTLLSYQTDYALTDNQGATLHDYLGGTGRIMKLMDLVIAAQEKQTLMQTVNETKDHQMKAFNL